MELESAACLAPDIVAAFLRRDLDRAQAEAVEVHVDACPECFALVAELARSPFCLPPPGVGAGPPTDVTPRFRWDDHESAAPSRLGRYLVIGEVGRGGMGVVYRAYDPRLGREVALKVLETRRSIDAHEDASSEAETRMLREARAMAQLSHPNVVPAFDVHQEDGRLYIALEFVDGRTLRQWLRAEPRSWREIVRVLCEAGRGLAAAHRAGLVHRDFKPTNVMVGNDGRVRVMDFGLARGDFDSTPTGAGELEALARLPAAGEDEVLGSVEDARGSLGDPLTQRGVALGTPVYMAPEQFDGRVADHRTDQYAFCVSMYEALYDQRPFGSVRVQDVANERRRGPLVRPPSADVPRWVHAIVERGLAVEPDDRWPSMETLLDALADDPRARLRRRVQLAGVAVFTLGGAASVWVVSGTREDVCARHDGSLDEAWNDTRRAAVRRALLQTDLPFAASTADRVIALLDDYAERWVEARRDSCVAALVRKQVSQDVLDRQNACFARHRMQLDTLVDALTGTVTVEMVESATQAVRSLPAIDRCGRPELLDAGVAPPEDPAVRDEVARLRDELARASAVLHVSSSVAVVEDIEAVVEHARQMSYTPILAEALVALGEARMGLGDPQATRSTLEEAYFAAIESGHQRVASDASALLVWVIGYRAAKPAEAEDWIRAAAAWSLHSSAPLEQRAQLLTDIAAVRKLEGRWKDVARSAADALALLRRVDDASALSMSRAIDLQAMADASLGRLDDALRGFDRVVEIRAEAFGDAHPSTAGARSNRAQILAAVGRTEEAVAETMRAIEAYEATYGDTHADLPTLYSALCGNQRRLGNMDAALASGQRAVELSRAHGGRSPQLVDALSKLAAVHRERDEPREAKRVLLEAVERVDASDLPHGHPLAPNVWHDLGSLLMANGDDDEARAWLERAVEGYAEVQAPDPDASAAARFRLARLLWASPPDRARAIELARAALETQRTHGSEDPELVQQLEAWLDGHDASR